LNRILLDLHEKIESLNAKPDLLSNLENFKKDAESKANNLEIEVKQLRELLSALKELLGLNANKIS
jgi:hypothetical protein